MVGVGPKGRKRGGTLRSSARGETGHVARAFVPAGFDVEVVPGNANLPIGESQTAIQENGVPG